MSKNVLLSIALLVIVVIMFSFKSSLKKDSRQPNIIFILSDDHSSLAISSYGSQLNKTPNIDRLASQGVLFKNAFVVSSLCSPSRASILTSQYGAESGFLRIGDSLNAAINTLPKILQQVNYETAILGKWHLRSQPLGFDYCQVVRDQGAFFDPKFLTSEQWTDKNNKGEEHKGYFTDIITDKAIKWLENRSSEKPFALFVHHKSPHAPHITPEKYDSLFSKDLPFPSTFHEEFNNKTSFLRNTEAPYSKLENAYESDVFNSLNTKRAPPGVIRGTAAYKEWAYQTLYKGYYRQIANLDDNVGRLLNYLDQEGLSENTIIVYTSDNGWFLGQHGLFNKMWMYEESLRVPLIISYPGHIASNKINNNIISSLDFAPTLLDYASAKVPSSMRGKSVRPILEGNEPANWRKSFFYHYYDQFGVPEILGIRTEQYKLINYIKGDSTEWEFYNLKNDPFEMDNQINNPDQIRKINELKNKLMKEKVRYDLPIQKRK
jgi:arylsulfatase A-like enzyme